MKITAKKTVKILKLLTRKHINHPHGMIFLYNKIMKKIQEQLIKENINGLWITDVHSINYLIHQHFHVGERFIGLYIPQEGEPTLVLNRLFTNETDIKTQYYFDFDDVYEVIADVTKGSVIGLDKTMGAQYVLSLQEKYPATTFIVGSQFVDRLRAIKTPQQIEKMKVASALNDKVMEEVKDFIQIGMTEIQIRDFIEERFSFYGSNPSFETIVAFKDHGVDPHAIPSVRKLKEGESIIVDMGCVVDGYCSDMTRTFFINHNPIEDIYEACLKANTQAIEAINNRSLFSDIDKVAREVISQYGYSEYFVHRLGHGIGQEVHEPYDVSSSNPQPIEPGMCFSIEPGIYKPTVDAVRIEDLVYVDEQGNAQVLNHVDKENPVLKR